jgi:hypothetical protein
VNSPSSSPHRSTTITLTVALVLVALMTPAFVYLAMAERAADAGTVDDPAKLMAFTVWMACVAVFLAVGIILLLRPLFIKAMRPRYREGKPVGSREALWQQLTSAPPAFDLAQAQEWLAEMRPLVEEIAGRQFRREPKLELVEWQQLGQVLANEKVVPLQTSGGGGLTDRLMELAALPSTLSLTPFIIGKYGVASQTVYLLPRNTAAVMELAKLGPEDVEPIVKLTICHELVHALQDDHLNLSECLRDAQSSGDPMSPFNVVMEGHAMLLQAQAAERLDLRTPQAALEGLLLGKEEDEAVEGTRMSQVYRLGMNYMDREFAAGGCERLWERLESPPNDLGETV